MTQERQPASRLPAEPGYWDDLAARSVAAALGARAGRAQPRTTPWWRGLADAAIPLAACAAFALIAGPLLLRDRPPAAAEPALSAALAPRDPLLANLLEHESGPLPAGVVFQLIAAKEQTR